LYSSARCADHLGKFISLPPATQGLFPNFSRTLDHVYTRVLAKSEDRPHFSNIIATIALQTDPPSVAELSELFDIDHSKVAQVLVNLEPIITIPEAIDAPVTVCHTSVRQFLTDKSRSGRFFYPYRITSSFVTTTSTSVSSIS
jgi:hypothetical protein